jgi:hypothetical protein
MVRAKHWAWKQVRTVQAINNSFNNLLGYPTRNKQELWPKFISVSGIELSHIFDKWKGRPARRSISV